MRLIQVVIVSPQKKKEVSYFIYHALTDTIFYFDGQQRRMSSFAPHPQFFLTIFFVASEYLRCSFNAFVSVSLLLTPLNPGVTSYQQ
jgi:hypothetical protein